MRALRVLHVIGGGDTGGAMTHLLPLLCGLQRAGCDAHLLCLGEGGLAERAGGRGLPVAVLPMRSARDPRVVPSLRRLLAGGPPGMAGLEGAPPVVDAWQATTAPSSRWDVVHTHGMRANLPVRMVLRTLRERPCLFTTVHSDLLLDYPSSGLARVYQALDRLTLSGVDRIICVSDALRVLLAGRGYPQERLLTVRSGLEMTGDGVGEGGPPPTAGGPPRPPRIGTIARLVAVKDLDLMLEVAGLLRRTHPEVQLLIVGDGPEAGRLATRAANLGLEDTVRFMGRLDDVGPVLDALDVYMVTSAFEGGVSMAVLEAMARGLPVVTTAAGGVAEAVVDGATGYVVERSEDRGALAAALAERVASLLDHPALRARMGAAGARRVRARFTAEQTAAQTLRAYERCLAERGGPS